ncbi:MAG: phospholipase C, phosphocholine-specific [Verrucomicrobiota bacterium]
MTVKHLLLSFVVFAAAAVAQATNVPPGLTGLWLFQTDATKFNGTVGGNLYSYEGDSGNSAWYAGPWTAIGTDANPSLYSDNGVIQDRSWDYLQVPHGISPNGGGAYVNNYTVMIDYQQNQAGAFNSLFQTASDPHGNDGDLFIIGGGAGSTIGCGALGYSSLTFDASQWHRIVWSVNNSSSFKVYVDGTLFLSAPGQGVDGRYSLNPTFYLSADNNWEDMWGLFGTVAVWDHALSASEVAGLGGVGTALTLAIPTSSLTNNLIFYAPFSNSLNDVQGGGIGVGAGGAAVQPSGGVSGGYLKLTNNATRAEQYVSYTDPTPSVGDFSFQVWVRSLDPRNGQALGDNPIAANKDWNSGANVGWILAQEIDPASASEFQWNMNTAGGTRKDFDPQPSANAVVFDGNWHQIVMTLQRSGTAVFYRDGILVASVAIAANIGQSLRPSLDAWVTNHILALGQDATLRCDHASGTAISSFNGDLDEVAMWSRVLSASDVLNAYMKGAGGLGLGAPLPVSFVQQPQGGTRVAGDGFLLSCAVAGDPAPALQWFHQGAPLAGATSSQFLLTNLDPTNSGEYTVVATGGGLSLTSNPAQLIVQPDTNVTHTIADVRHVVIFMQENRSFDQYFGSFPGVCGFNDRNALRFQNGKTDFYQPQGGGYVLPFPVSYQCLEDLDHGWGTGHAAWNSGRWDSWIAAKGTTTMSYYTRSSLPFHYALAEAFTLCDHYHCSVMGPSDPNRLYLWTATIDPNGTGGGPAIDNSEPGFTWTTYPERLQNAGINWKVYQETDNYDDNALAWFVQYRNAAPGNPLYDNGMATVPDLVAAFKKDVTNGTLPRVSWIIAKTADSEHPPYSPANGAVLTRQLLDALHSNPAIYNSTVFMLTWDENDGFFDHVPPPVPPPGTPDEFVGGLPVGLGARVPMLLISPWSRGGYVCSQVFDHSSTIRFLETWTGVQEPNISAWRRQVCGDLTAAFDFKNPNTNYPSLPAVTGVTCSSGTTPAVPSPQSFPAQETGWTIPRPLPYQPNAASSADCGSGRLFITLTNSGDASVHFAIYANAYRSDGPWPYDVAPNTAAWDSFDVTAAGGSYDLACYGPNGFQRRFAGNINADCGAVEVTSSFDDRGLTLALRNSTASAVGFILTNSYVNGASWTENVAAGSTGTVTVPALVDNNGWYDVTVTLTGNAAFLRRLAGHIETVTPSMAAAVSGGNTVLTYPDWANGYMLEGTTNLASGSWSAVNAAPIIFSNKTVVTLPAPTNDSMYFRLRH